MKLVVQRVSTAKVSVDKQITGQINNGLLVLVGFTINDNETTINKMVDKIINLRIFNDDNHNMNLSLLDIKGSILSVSQFTLYADTNQGRRPSFTKALNKDEAEKLYQLFNNKLKEKNIKVEAGIFGAEMDVEFINTGPVTIVLDSKED